MSYKMDCGGKCGTSCDPCIENPCCNSCNQPCIRWGFDGCYLRGRCADGTELTPLDLCAWLKQHETCTTFQLVPNGEGGSYMEFLNECGESQKLFVCDFLALGELSCLSDVKTKNPQSCDLLVFDPSCGEACGDYPDGKWTNYHIPDAGDCELEPDDEGFYHVLIKDDCGCIKECKLFAQTRVWEWQLRDSWPDDPDWPWSQGVRKGDNTEIIDIELDKRCPMFGKTDLEVTVQYAYGIQNIGVDGTAVYNFKSTVVPMNKQSHYPDVTSIMSDAIVVQDNNSLPWGSHEYQVSRTFIIPKGEKLYLNHSIEMRNINAQEMPDTYWFGESDNPTHDCSRLHALHVFVRAVQGEHK